MYLMHSLCVLNFRGRNFLKSSQIASYFFRGLCVYKWLESVQFRHAICTCVTGWNSVVAIRTTSILTFQTSASFPRSLFKCYTDHTRKDDHSTDLTRKHDHSTDLTRKEDHVTDLTRKDDHSTDHTRKDDHSTDLTRKDDHSVKQR
jgi:hypothetical protein